MKYKIDKLDLLDVLYKIEDKRDYNCKTISKHIDKLQRIIKPKLNKILLDDNSCLTELEEDYSQDKDVIIKVWYNPMGAYQYEEIDI